MRTAAIIIVAGLLAVGMLAGCRTSGGNKPAASPEFPNAVPAQADWGAPAGTGLTPPDAGGELWPGVACYVDGKVLLYLCHALQRDPAHAGQPNRKNCAVADTTDGTRYVLRGTSLKAGAFPNDCYNEGACPTGYALTGSEVWLYYGWAQGRSAVRVDVGLFRMNAGGLTVGADGIALRYDQPSPPKPWPNYSGDEVVPALNYEHNGTWVCYYITDRKQLGVAWGPGAATLTSSAMVPMTDVWFMGGGGAQRLADGRMALFFTVCPPGSMKPAARFIRCVTVDPANPAAFTHATDYTIGPVMAAAICYDRARSKWRLFTNGNLGARDECLGEIQMREAGLR